MRSPHAPQKTVILFAVLLCLAACAQASSNADTAIAAVLAANDARNTALVDYDLGALDTILAPDFNHTHSNNLQETKTSHTGSLVDGLRNTKYETSDLRVNVITPRRRYPEWHLRTDKGKERQHEGR